MQTRRAQLLRVILTVLLTLLLLILAQTIQAADKTPHRVTGIVQQISDSLYGQVETPSSAP